MTWAYTVYTENVAMATMMIQFDRAYNLDDFDRAYRELFNSASHNSLSQMEVEIEQFKSFTNDFGCDIVTYRTDDSTTAHGGS